MEHQDVWRALDTLAAEHGLSVSGLARHAGLNPTTFNRSKRMTHDGRARWPNTESIAKVLRATGASLEAFTALVTGLPGQPQARPVRRIPLLDLSLASGSSSFDATGSPAGLEWGEAPIPEIADTHAYALRVDGDALDPVFRNGMVLLVSPAAPVRGGDRVVARTRRGDVITRLLASRSARRIEFQGFGASDSKQGFGVRDVMWIHRIVWASQ